MSLSTKSGCGLPQAGLMKLKLFRVSGDSMSPQFVENDYVLAFSRRNLRLKPGQVVVVSHPLYGTIIKRIAQITNDHKLRLRGDNQQQSTSTEALGEIIQEQVIGRVVWHIPSTFRS